VNESQESPMPKGVLRTRSQTPATLSTPRDVRKTRSFFARKTLIILPLWTGSVPFNSSGEG